MIRRFRRRHGEAWMQIRSTGLAVVLLGISGTAIAAPPVQSTDRPFRLCVLDQAMLVPRSRLAQTMGAHFQQIRQQAQAKMDDERRTLEADVRALDSLRASLPPAVAKTRDTEIAQRRAALKERGEQTNRNLVALDAELTANVVKAAEPIVRTVEKDRGCSVLIGKEVLLHLGDTSLDITMEVIARMNVTSPSSPGRR